MRAYSTLTVCRAHRLNACGYSLGAKFTPSWMDPPMFYERNSFVIERNQVFFLHMILMDSDSGDRLLPRADLSRRRRPCRSFERARTGPAAEIGLANP